jgi:hypothetical protein
MGRDEPGRCSVLICGQKYIFRNWRSHYKAMRNSGVEFPPQGFQNSMVKMTQWHDEHITTTYISPENS